MDTEDFNDNEECSHAIKPSVIAAIKRSNDALAAAVAAHDMAYDIAADADKARRTAEGPNRTMDDINAYVALDKAAILAYQLFTESSAAADAASAAAIVVARDTRTPLRCLHFKLIQPVAPDDCDEPAIANDVYFPKPIIPEVPMCFRARPST
jgi:hypothetical protein